VTPVDLGQEREAADAHVQRVVADVVLGQLGRHLITQLPTGVLGRDPVADDGDDSQQYQQHQQHGWPATPPAYPIGRLVLVRYFPIGAH